MDVPDQRARFRRDDILYVYVRDGISKLSCTVLHFVGFGGSKEVSEPLSKEKRSLLVLPD